jgi:hypothetical protein
MIYVKISMVVKTSPTGGLALSSGPVDKAVVEARFCRFLRPSF